MEGKGGSFPRKNSDVGVLRTYTAIPNRTASVPDWIHGVLVEDASWGRDTALRSRGAGSGSRHGQATMRVKGVLTKGEME